MPCVVNVPSPDSKLSGLNLESLLALSISGRDHHTNKKQGCVRILDAPTRPATPAHCDYDIVGDNTHDKFPYTSEAKCAVNLPFQGLTSRLPLGFPLYDVEDFDRSVR